MRLPPADFWAGARDVVPVLLGNMPFALVFGATAVAVGLTTAQTLGSSVFIFGGAAQLAAVQVLDRGAPAVVVLLTALVVNARHVMYSASIAPYFRRFSRRQRWGYAYLLTDPAYALSITEFHDRTETDARRWYYLGVAVPLWVNWQIWTVAGVLLGASLPAWLQVDFVVPLIFLSLLVPTIEDRATGVTAAAAGAIAVVGVGLPYQLGLLAGALVGTAVGLASEEAA